MKTREFINQLEDLGFESERQTNMGISRLTRIMIHHPTTEMTVAIVYLNDCYSLDTSLIGFAGLEVNLKRKLFAVLFEYVLTPVSEREYEMHLPYSSFDDIKYAFTQSEVDTLLAKWRPFYTGPSKEDL